MANVKNESLLDRDVFEANSSYFQPRPSPSPLGIGDCSAKSICIIEKPLTDGLPYAGAYGGFSRPPL